MLPGEALELAALLAIKQQDEAAMERAFTQLKVFYDDTKWVLGLWVILIHAITMRGRYTIVADHA
jgi:hypothetical protein